MFCVLCPSPDRFSAQSPGCGTDRGKFLPQPFHCSGARPVIPLCRTLFGLYSNKFIGRFEKCDDKILQN